MNFSIFSLSLPFRWSQHHIALSRSKRRVILVLVVTSNLQHNCCLVVHYNPDTRVSNGSGAVQIWYSREFGLLPVTHQWHVPTTVLWWVTGARWVSGATCCSRFHPLGACDFDTNGWWVSGATSAADSVILLTDDQQKETLESLRGKPVHSLVIS